jgi:hypothetical protein
VLCLANPSQHACPSCGSSLLSETQKTKLLTRLQTQLVDTLASEERARLQAAEEARRAIGAFPTLSGAPPSAAPTPQQPQTRTVLSLGGKGKRGPVTVSTYTKVAPTPSSSAPSSRPVTPELDPPRVPAPTSSVLFVAGARVDPARPFFDLGGNGAVYIPPVDLGDGEEDGAGGEDGAGAKKRRRRRGGKGKEKENGGGEGPAASSSTATT